MYFFRGVVYMKNKLYINEKNTATRQDNSGNVPGPEDGSLK